jgi:N-acetylmuramoyl-L-alanine amidase
MDVTKIIEPVMRPGQIRNAGAVRTVVLDAGHGGHDSGAKGQRGLEKEAALDVVLRAKRLLEQAGYTVRLTRGRDVFIPLENRAAFANRFPNAIFVSVHFNKSAKGGASGIETFALAPRGVPSMDEENFSYSDLKQHPGHARDPENIALATALHSSMLRHMRLHDRGIKRARFVVIRDIRIPGVLLEGGFMNHPVDGRLIASPAYRDSFARAILDGVNRYQKALAGTMSFQKPSAVAGGADPTSVPDIRSRLSTIGMAPTLNEAVQRTAQELKKKAKENASTHAN